MKPALCIAGPTASGKTAAALALALEYDVEIISVDSALVYRDMDIGTAKPRMQPSGSEKPQNAVMWITIGLRVTL